MPIGFVTRDGGLRVAIHPRAFHGSLTCARRSAADRPPALAARLVGDVLRCGLRCLDRRLFKRSGGGRAGRGVGRLVDRGRRRFAHGRASADRLLGDRLSRHSVRRSEPEQLDRRWLGRSLRVFGSAALVTAIGCGSSRTLSSRRYRSGRYALTVEVVARSSGIAVALDSALVAGRCGFVALVLAAFAIAASAAAAAPPAALVAIAIGGGRLGVAVGFVAIRARRPLPASSSADSAAAIIGTLDLLARFAIATASAPSAPALPAATLLAIVAGFGGLTGFGRTIHPRPRLRSRRARRRPCLPATRLHRPRSCPAGWWRQSPWPGRCDITCSPRSMANEGCPVRVVSTVDGDRNLEALFQHAQMRALVVEHIDRDLGARAHDQIVGGALEQGLFHRANQLQRHRRHRTHMTGAAAMRADLGRAFQHRRTDALARHFQQAEMRDAADLDAGAIAFQRLLHLALDRTVVAAFIHVDEVDHDQAGQIAQTELAGDFGRGLRCWSWSRSPRSNARGWRGRNSRRSRPAPRSG